MTHPKQYLRPTTPEEAAVMLASPSAYGISGGALALGRLDLPYETLVDVDGIGELQQTRVDAHGITFGTAVKLQALVEHPQLSPLHKRALTRAIPVNLRNNTSILEALTVQRFPSEWVTLLAAQDARITRMDESGVTETFSITETQLVAGGTGRLLLHGLLTELHIQHLAENEALGMAHVARTPAADPIVSAAVIVRLQADKTVFGAFAALYGASGTHPIDVFSLGDLYNKPLSAQSIAAQAAAIGHVVSPRGDYLGSADYRRQMSQVVVRRALEDAAAQLAAQPA